MDNRDQFQRNKKGAKVLGYAIAAALGAALGMLFAPQKESNGDPNIKNKAKQMADKFRQSAEEVRGKVKQIFDDVSDEIQRDYLEIRGQVLAKFYEMKGRADVNRKKYEEMVDDAVQKFSKKREWTKQSIQRLSDTLKEEYDAFKEKMKNDKE